MSDTPIHPFTAEISDQHIEDLRRRLSMARLPDEETVEDWSQGLPLSYTRDLLDYWRDQYGMDRVAHALQQWPNFKTDIDGLGIHFLHIRSSHSTATPLILTHGWPGSILEFRHLIARLTEPTEYGGTPDDAFHLVIPSLPGYGFSDKPRQTGWSVEKIGRAWITLMRRLGYETFLAHGGDWGSMVTQAVALAGADSCLGIHITLPVVAPDPETLNDPLPEEVRAMEAFDYYQQWDSGYSKQQSTRPQTLGYGLADSPVGQMAWVVEKYAQWCDCEENGMRFPEKVVSRDELLDTVMIYWLNNAGASSARLYWESFNTPNLSPIGTATGISLFPQEIFRASRRWAEKRFENLVYFNDQIPSGGHFAALEVPETLSEEIRAWRRTL